MKNDNYLSIWEWIKVYIKNILSSFLFNPSLKLDIYNFLWNNDKFHVQYLEDEKLLSINSDILFIKLFEKRDEVGIFFHNSSGEVLTDVLWIDCKSEFDNFKKSQLTSIILGLIDQEKAHNTAKKLNRKYPFITAIANGIDIICETNIDYLREQMRPSDILLIDKRIQTIPTFFYKRKDVLKKLSLLESAIEDIILLDHNEIEVNFIVEFKPNFQDYQIVLTDKVEEDGDLRVFRDQMADDSKYYINLNNVEYFNIEHYN